MTAGLARSILEYDARNKGGDGWDLAPADLLYGDDFVDFDDDEDEDDEDDEDWRDLCPSHKEAQRDEMPISSRDRGRADHCWWISCGYAGCTTNVLYPEMGYSEACATARDSGWVIGNSGKGARSFCPGAHAGGAPAWYPGHSSSSERTSTA